MITAALAELGIQVRLGRRIVEVTDRVVLFADGSAVQAATVIWWAGTAKSG